MRQHVVANLGRLDELTASGRLEQLAAGLARLHQPPPGTRRSVGPLLIVAHYLRALDVAGTVDTTIPRRGKALAGHGEIACVLAASRLCSPAPLYDIAGWASSAAVAELLGVPAALLNDDRLGRSLEALAKVAEDVRGQLMLTAIRRFAAADASRLHLDLTAVRFAGHYGGPGLVEKGWPADRTIARQVKTLQATVPSGAALYFRPHKGSANELPAFMAALETLAAALPPGLVIVADSGLGYLENLCAADTAGVRFVVPLRADTGWAARFTADVPAGLDALQILDHVSHRERDRPAGQRTLWKGLLAPFPPSPKTAPATTCAPHTSGHQNKPPPSAKAANAPSPRPKQRWPECATGWAAATTRPASRSTPKSRRSSPATPPALSTSPPPPGPASPSSAGTATPKPSPQHPSSTGCTRWPQTCPATTTAPR
ncbi:MAG: IS1634 family transposase [Streptosporangiaceae bacterium]